jgi:hypothetical protein
MYSILTFLLFKNKESNCWKLVYELHFILYFANPEQISVLQQLWIL